MRIIPAINCQEFADVKERFHIAQEILFGADNENRETGEHDEWIHIDIADGGFTNGYSTWRNVQEFAELKRHPNLKIEVHIMMHEPEAVISEWLALGVHRIIFHLESAGNVEAIAAMCEQAGVEAMLALNPETPIAHAAPYLESVSGCQILAVAPGLSGQSMDASVPAKVADVRARYPHLIIEVDGGITPATALMCKKAGAHQLVVGSYIFRSDNPAGAYGRLAENA